MNQLSKSYTTDALGAIFGVKPQSIRARYCTTGSYFGLIPRKLPNGRLIWDREEVETFLSKSAA